MQNQAPVAHPVLSASILFDIVVFAGGKAPGLNPLCDNEPKPMLCICNRPMIWYCLSPWIKAGCSTFFVCVNEDYAALQSYLCREFPKVAFVFVLVPLTQNQTPTTTCDVVRGYLKHKESLKSDRLSKPRDALLLSCDTFLPGVDVEHFIHNFYASVASVSVLLFRPISSSNGNSCGTQLGPTARGNSASTPAGSGKGNKGSQGSGACAAKPYTHHFTCVAYEEKSGDHVRNDNNNNGSALCPVASGVTENSNKGSNCVSHHRLHFICPREDEPEPCISFGFAARRPNLTFAADVVDVHAYLVRNWVLHYMAESTGEGMTVQRDCIPFLARSQHSTVNVDQGVLLRPDNKLKYTIPNHWLFDESSPVPLLNGRRGPVLPVEADNLLVCCTIYEEDAAMPMRAFRAKTRKDFVALNHDILLSKCEVLGLAEGTGDLRSTKQQHQAERHHHQKQTASNHNCETAVEMFPSLPASALALCNLLPDSPITVVVKNESSRVHIKCSFLRSAPAGSAFITSSIVGSNVILGSNVRITNSIILDNAEIGANSTITGSVIGSSAMLNPGIRVVNCVVGPQCLVESDKKDSVIRV
ncbi:nucleotidyl transferase, putative [Trypanosoma equiperdum]|uniref:Translation initiation factor eIF2B subunit gamma n=2 Tax=Trypanozoon TaxID=39700 RepID=Q383B0_TRYB2|nr:hypothetical protein, conserved [Trypanosoma brucei brucei TREU927]EAN80121.1 hypothetical protein, conserved [Trypanosoma brucei brucei TREU927]SCU72411.1 nucleotidyl transferase, putative [Trypanosoma equiperdum]